MNETLDEVNDSPSRPTFLTVLCILTFIGSSYGIIDGLLSYVNADESVAAKELIQESMDEALEEMEDDGQEKGAEMVNRFMGDIGDAMTVEKIQSAALGGILASVFTLLGALLMWRLKKIGFYSYILGTVISIAVPVMVYGGGLIGSLTAGIIALIGIIFVVLYGVNFKHLKY